jgi:hypothetical protein
MQIEQIYTGCLAQGVHNFKWEAAIIDSDAALPRTLRTRQCKIKIYFRNPFSC